MRGDKNERPSPQASPPAGRGGVYLKNRVKLSNIFGYYINLRISLSDCYKDTAFYCRSGFNRETIALYGLAFGESSYGRCDPESLRDYSKIIQLFQHAFSPNK